jgi:putative hydrolase of the HAD superfamily
VVTSVAVGSPKPARAAFDRGLALAGAAAGAAWHVGDDLDADIGGARAAGVRPVLVDRDGDGPAPPGGVPVVRALDELPGLVGRPSP